MSGNALSLPLAHSGKVRDSYRADGGMRMEKVRLVRVSDRISIFDFVLGFEIPQKGEVLAVLNAFWRQHLLSSMRHTGLPAIIQTDTLAVGPGIDKFLPPKEQGNRELWKRASVVRELEMFPYEAVVRGYLTGSGYEAYKKEGTVCGHKLPLGLRDGSKLPAPIFTPTTKAEVGHDEHLSYKEVNAKAPQLEAYALAAYKEMAAYALSRGLIIADTKMEFGKRQFMRGRVIALADEVGTPDSSRIWKKADYDVSYPMSLPPAFDKQFVREWGKKEGINDAARFDPKSAKDRAAVKRIVPPRSVIDDTRDIYLSVPQMLTGLTLPQCQKEFLGV